MYVCLIVLCEEYLVVVGVGGVYGCVVGVVLVDWEVVVVVFGCVVVVYDCVEWVLFFEVGYLVVDFYFVYYVFEFFLYVCVGGGVC